VTTNYQKSHPNKSPLRRHPRVVGVRIPDGTYEELKAIAADKGITLAEVIRERLERGSSTAPSAA
jgi:predicted DNA-binding protein